VGNAKFWKEYLSFIKPLEQYIRTKLTKDESEFLYSIADPVSNCGHIPFIIERMFTTLIIHNKHLRYKAYEYDAIDLKRRYSRVNRLAYESLQSFNRFPYNILRPVIIRIILMMRQIRDLKS